MSGWKLAVRHLSGRPYGTVNTMADEHCMTNDQSHHCYSDAKARGLVDHCEGRAPGAYRLTRLGADYAAGRVAAVRRNPGGIRFEATFLAGMPREVATA